MRREGYLGGKKGFHNPVIHLLSLIKTAIEKLTIFRE